MERRITMEKNFCEHCGAGMEPNDLFCPSCGQKIIDMGIKEDEGLTEYDTPDEPQEPEAPQAHHISETPEVSQAYQAPQAPETLQTYQAYQAPETPGIHEQPGSFMPQPSSANPFKQFSSNMGPSQSGRRTSNRGMILSGTIVIIVLAVIITIVMLFSKFSKGSEPVRADSNSPAASIQNSSGCDIPIPAIGLANCLRAV